MEADPPAWPKPLWRGEGPTKAYNQDDATGFIRLNALRLKVAAKVHGKKQ
jgi:argininosuccinate synthase